MDAVQAMNNFNQTIMAGAQMIQANKSSKADRKMVQRENQKSREWNEKMWHLQNEFNSPTAQLARFVDAGLNPALAYGEVTSGLATNPNGSYGQGSTNPDQTSARMAEAAQLFNQMSLTNSAIRVNDSQAEANLALADKYKSETTGQTISNTYEGAVLNYRVSQAKENLRGSSIANDVADFQKSFTYIVKGQELAVYENDKKEGYNYFSDKREKELGLLINTINKIYADEQYQIEAKELLGYNAETGRISANAMALNAANYAYLVPYLAAQASAQANLFGSQAAYTDKQTKYFEVGVLKTLTEAYELYQKGKLTKENIDNMVLRNFNLENFGNEEPSKGGIMGSGVNLGNYINFLQNNASKGVGKGVYWLVQWLYQTATK